MNRQDDLLVPFPTTCRRQETGGHELDWHSMVRRQSVQYQNGKRISSFRNRRSRSMIPSHTPVPDVDDVESDNYSHNRMMDDSLSSHFNAISVANVVGDDNEFRRLQEDLRNSRTITGTKQVLNQFLESRGRNVEEKRQNHPELNKIKHFHTAPAKPSAGMMIRSFGKRLSQSFGDSKSSQD